MTEHPVAQLRLEPGALRRHDAACVCDRHQFLDSGRIHGKGEGVISALNELLQFCRAADSTDKTNPLARPGIIDSEYRLQDVRLQQAYVQRCERIFRGGQVWTKPQCPPLAVQIKSEFVTGLRLRFALVAKLERGL